MKVIARGYSSHYPSDTRVLCEMVITPQQAEDHEGLPRGLWWHFEYVPSRLDRFLDRTEDTVGRISGYVLVLCGLLALVGLAGWIEAQP